MPIILVDMNFQIRVVNEAYAAYAVSVAATAQDDPPRFQDPGPERGRIKTGDPGEETECGEVLVEFPTGVKRLQQYGIPIQDNSGNVTSILVVYNDITEDRRQMEEITELHRTADTIVQQNPIPMLMTDPGFSVVEANAAYAKMSGIPRDRVIGMSLREVKILEQKGEGARVAIEKKQPCIR